MLDKSKHIEHEQLIVCYINGEANDKDKKLLLKWLKEKPEHMQEFDRLRSIAKALSSKPDMSRFDLENAISKFEEAITTESKTIQFETKTKKTIWWRISSAAAVAIILLGLFFFKFNKPQIQVLAQADDVAKELTLADGTFALLSPNSQLTASEDFGSKHRKLTLKGEVYVKVKHDSEHPFIIEVNDVNITDIGTAFKVTADSLSGNVSVKVDEGIVQLDYAGKTQILHAGEFAFVRAKERQIQSGKTELKPLRKQIEGSLTFENTPLNIVVERLNSRYNVKFALESPELSQQCIYASFDDSMSVEEVTELLQAILNVKVNNENGVLKISQAE